MPDITGDNGVVTSSRRKKFADTLKDRGVRRSAQITRDVQIELFDLCETPGERCALRRFLTEEYRMSIGPDGILTEKEFMESTPTPVKVDALV